MIAYLAKLAVMEIQKVKQAANYVHWVLIIITKEVQLLMTAKNVHPAPMEIHKALMFANYVLKGHIIGILGKNGWMLANSVQRVLILIKKGILLSKIA